MRAGLRFQAVHWLPRGLADSNPRPANPSDVWANDGAYHDPPPGVVAKRGTTPLSGQKESLGSRSTGRFPKLETGCALERPRAFSAVARLGGNVPAWLYSDFKVQKRLLFCPFTDIAAKGPIKPSLIPKKFLSFSSAVPSSDRLPLQKCRLFVRFHGCCIHPFS